MRQRADDHGLSGYYGAWLNGRNDFYQVHCGFDQAHHSFEAANTPKAKFLHYTTWNDHDETSLLPMVFTPANPLITRAYTARFKGESTVTGEPEVVFRLSPRGTARHAAALRSDDAADT